MEKSNIYNFIKIESKRKKIEFELCMENVEQLVFNPCESCGDSGTNSRSFRISGAVNTIFYNGLDRINSNKDYSTNSKNEIIITKAQLLHF